MQSSRGFSIYCLITDAGGQGERIPAGSDLDTYRIPGVYYLLSSDLSSVSNVPTSTPGRLEIKRFFNSNAEVLQEYYSFEYTVKIFVRRFTAQTWGAWTRLTTTA